MSGVRQGARHLAAGVILSATLVAPLQAQVWPPISNEIKRGRVRVGPLALTPRFELRNAGVDTNVFLTPTEPTRDTSVVLRGSLDGYLPVGPRLRLVGAGWLDFNYFKTISAESSTDPGGEGHFEFDIWRLTLIGGGGGFRSRQLYTTDIDERIERREEWWSAGSRLRITNQLNIEFGVEDRKYRWGESVTSGGQVASQLDRDTTTYEGAARVRLSALTDLVASAERIEDTFLVATPGLETTTSYRYLAGFEFGERAFMTGRILAGVRDIPAGLAGSAPIYRGPVIEASVVVPFVQSVRLSAGYSRDVSYSASSGTTVDPSQRNAYLHDRIQGDLDVEGPLDVVLRLTGGYENARYLRPVATADGSIDRRDRVYAAGASLLWRIGDTVLLGVTALHSRRDSNDPAGIYDRWQYGVQGFINP